MWELQLCLVICHVLPIQLMSSWISGYNNNLVTCEQKLHNYVYMFRTNVIFSLMVSKVMNVPENAHYIYAVLNHLSNMSKLLMAKCFWLVEAQEKKGENKKTEKKRQKIHSSRKFSWNLSREKKREIQNGIICAKTNLQPKSVWSYQRQAYFTLNFSTCKVQGKLLGRAANIATTILSLQVRSIELFVSSPI